MITELSKLAFDITKLKLASLLAITVGMYATILVIPRINNGSDHLRYIGVCLFVAGVAFACRYEGGVARFVGKLRSSGVGLLIGCFIFICAVGIGLSFLENLR